MIDRLAEMDEIDRDKYRRLVDELFRLVAELGLENVTGASVARMMLRYGGALAVDCVGPETAAKLCETLAWEARIGDLTWRPINSAAGVKLALLEIHVAFRKSGRRRWTIDEVNDILMARNIHPLTVETYLRLAPSSDEIDVLVTARRGAVNERR